MSVTRGLGCVDRACRGGTVETAALDSCRHAPSGFAQEQSGKRLLVTIMFGRGSGLYTCLHGGAGGALVRQVGQQVLVRDRGEPPIEQALGAKEEGLVHEGAGSTPQVLKRG